MNKKPIFKAKLDVDFFIIENRFVLSDEYKKQVIPKKITGTRLGNIVADNTSQIKAWMQMFNLYTEPFDPIYSEAGKVIEEKLRDYYVSLTNINYLSYDPKSVKWDLFSDNKIFGGIPDGEPTEDNQVNYDNKKRMLEAKTTSIDSFVFKKDSGFFVLQKDENGVPLVKLENGKYESWFNDEGIVVPPNYLFQLSLYMYLRKVEFGVFVIGFVPTLDYVKPELFDTSVNEVRVVNYQLDLSKFAWFIQYGTKWWNTYVTSGISPKLSQDDLNWFYEIYDNK